MPFLAYKRHLRQKGLLVAQSGRSVCRICRKSCVSVSLTLSIGVLSIGFPAFHGFEMRVEVILSLPAPLLFLLGAVGKQDMHGGTCQ
jgi:hypothetical protein